MSTSGRQAILAAAARLRRARAELEKAQADLDAALARWPAQVSAADASKEVAEALSAILGGAGIRPPSGEGAHEAAVGQIFGNAIMLAAARSATRSLARRKRPSTAARALAVLLEEPARDLGAEDVARRCGCSQAVARATLHRLVKQGLARRTDTGLFRAR